MNRTYLGLAALVIFLLVLAGITFIAQPTMRDTSKLHVTTSFYPVYFLASEIGGEFAEVQNITPAGAEAHDYEPTPRELTAIEGSHLFIINGAGFEAWGEDIVAQLDPTRTIVVEAGEDLASLEATEEEHEEEEPAGHDYGAVDPHVWLSPVLAAQMADVILEGFVAADPAHEAEYTLSAETLKAELVQLDADYRAGLTSCARRDIITSHAAFGYIADAYGLRQVSIRGLSTEEEPSAQELAEISQFAKDNNVKYIFFETLVSPKLSETIATEVGAQTLVLNPLEGLTNEEMSAGKNYLTEMRTNLANLQLALECHT